jgi:hypothetical protein
MEKLSRVKAILRHRKYGSVKLSKDFLQNFIDQSSVFYMDALNIIFYPP